MKAEDLSPDALAKACAESMWENDQASQGLGMQMLRVSSGQADLRMVVRENMTNGQKICHGGFIFTLADSAFAFACNGYNQFTVAQRCGIDFIAPAYAGDELLARARERNRSGRSGIYDVSVINQNGEVIAEMRGNSRTVKGQHIGGEG